MDRKKRVLLIALAAAAAVLIFAALRVTGLMRARSAAAAPTPEPTVMTPAPTDTPVPTPEPTPEPYVSPIDFEALRAQNEHIYAWLELPDTWLAYPILQHPTVNTYYLDITPDGYEGYPGSIFTFPVEGKTFEQFNTVIYGHNMNDGSMFGGLGNFRDSDYMREHRTLYIYLPEATLSYTVFAALTYDDRLITDSFREDTPEARQAYLDSIFSHEGCFLTEDLDLGPDSRLITMSTCIGGMPNNRLLVLAVLTDWASDTLDYTPPSPAPTENAPSAGE